MLYRKRSVGAARHQKGIFFDFADTPVRGRLKAKGKGKGQRR